jgi:hypothetical protein
MMAGTRDKTAPKLWGIFPGKFIADNNHPDRGPLMIRWYLIKTRWFGLFVHRFLRSDNDRHFHDHPWAFLTWLVGGGYWEHVPVDPQEPCRFPGIRKWRPRWSLLYRPALWLHWVEVPQVAREPGTGFYRDGVPIPVTTLVLVMHRQKRMWGFETERGWMDYQKYEKEFRD